MKKIIGAFAIIALLGGGIYYAMAYTMESRFISACDESMQNRLKSPSSYKRLDVTFNDEKMELTDYIAVKTRKIDATGKFALSERRLRATYQAQIAEAQSGIIHPVKIEARISYDASNAYGVPLRNSFHCLTISDSPDPKKFYPNELEIDGVTFADFISGLPAK